MSAPIAVIALADAAEIGRNGARIAAASAILDRGWGKPTVAVVACDPPKVIRLNFGFQKPACLATPERDRGTNPAADGSALALAQG
jgi:hypothetical protein